MYTMTMFYILVGGALLIALIAVILYKKEMGDMSKCEDEYDEDYFNSDDIL